MIINYQEKISNMEYAQNLILDINPQTGLTTNSKNVIKLRLLRNSQFAKWLSECP